MSNTNCLLFYHFLFAIENFKMLRIHDLQKRYMVIDKTLKVVLRNYKNIMFCRV